MHPNLDFRSDDSARQEALLDQIGFAMILLNTPDGLRVAHTPLLSTGAGSVRFHLARGNALTRHLDGATAMAVVNGADSYVSPRWYADANQVPTWNYVALELDGRVRKLDEDSLVDLLEALSARHEARIVDGKPWTMDKLSAGKRRTLLAGILGFELEIETSRATFKLSQNKPVAERERVIAGLDASGECEIARLMRELPG